MIDVPSIDTGTAADAGSSDIGWDGRACDVFDASGLDDAQVAAGRQAVLQVYSCYVCHQDPADSTLTLNGNASGNWGSAVYPPNLTNSPAGIGCWTNQEVENAVLHGLDPAGDTLCPPMPVWSKSGMDAGTAQQIIAFLRSLPPSNKTVPDTVCSMASDSGSPDDAQVDAPNEAWDP